MNLEVVLVGALLLMIAAASLIFGGKPERSVGRLLIAWLAIDSGYHFLVGPTNFHMLDPVHAGLDLIVFVVLLHIAIEANRIWTLVAASLQLLTLVGHIVVLLEFGGMQRAYWAMTQVPPDGIGLTLAIGTIFHRLRWQRIGTYPDWKSELVWPG